MKPPMPDRPIPAFVYAMAWIFYNIATPRVGVLLALACAAIAAWRAWQGEIVRLIPPVFGVAGFSAFAVTAWNAHRETAEMIAREERQ